MRIAAAGGRLKDLISRKREAITISYPSPVGGWNARDALADMKPTDAVALVNWFPRSSYVEIRGGYSSHATGLTGNGKTLMVHSTISGTQKMFAATASGIYDVSSSGAVGAAVLARTNGKHQYTMFGDGTNNWLIACNGVDKPAYYNGTAWTAVDAVSAPALTGVTSTRLVQPLVYKGRLFFVEVDTLAVWYLTAGAAGGALTKFDFSSEFKRGGYLQAIGNWTRDAGNGQDDVFVAVSSEGEAVVYQGNNPSSSTTWAKIGTYFIGKPIGRRCLCQLGGDLLVLVDGGAYPMSAALQSATIDHKLALSFKIRDAFLEATRNYSSVFGWEATVFTTQGALIVNIPIAEDTTHQQYVMNTVTKAWCKFTDWNAETFVVFGGNLYFASGTAVYKAWTGFIDGSNDIAAYGKSAFSYFGKPSRVKHNVLYRPVLAVNGPLSFLADIDVDFQDVEITGTATYATVGGARWDVGLWDGSFWAAVSEIIRRWKAPAHAPGLCFAPKIKVATNSLLVQWMSNDFSYKEGDGL